MRGIKAHLNIPIKMRKRIKPIWRDMKSLMK
jgi:hypothetical protein